MTGDELAPAGHLGLSADEVLTTTRAVRKRLNLSRRVPRSIVEECVRVAVQAPSGRNRQRWDFVFVEDAAQRSAVADLWRRGLAEAVSGVTASGPSRMDFAGDEWSRIAVSLDHLYEHLHEVPLLMVPCLRVGSRAELATVRGQAGAWGSVIPAFWSFMLAARERGIGTAWTTSHLAYEEEMAALLGIPFESVVQVALTPVAYTLGTAFHEGPRSDPRGFTHWNEW